MRGFDLSEPPIDVGIKSTITPWVNKTAKGNLNGWSFDVGCGNPRIARTSMAHRIRRAGSRAPRRRRRAGHSPHVSPGNLAELLERQPIHLGAKIEAQIRNALGFGPRLRNAVALLFNRGQDGFGIHIYSLNSLIRVLN